MPTPLRRRLRLARRGAWYVVAGVLVCMALVLGVASQVLPLAERHPEKIATWLSARAGRPVAFDHVETQWTRRGPLLRLDGLRLGEGADAVRIGEAEVLVSMYAGLLPGRSFTELRLRGLSLTLRRADDGMWSVLGLPGQAGGGDPLKNLEGLGELQVIGGKLSVQAPSLGWNVSLPRIDLRLRVDGDRVRAGTRAWARADGIPVQAAFDFDRGSGDGRAYMDTQVADIAAWAPLLRYAGVTAESGKGRVQGWAELRKHRVVLATSELKLQQVQLGGVPMTDGGAIPRARFERVEGLVRWRLTGKGWRFDAPRLLVGDQQSPQKLDGLVLAGGREYALLADRIDAAPLLTLLGLSDRVDPGLRQWLSRAKPNARLSRLSLAGDGAGGMHATGRLEGISFLAIDHSPGIDGLAGEFTGDSEGLALKLDPASRLRFDWPSGFGVAHDVTLDGSLAAWREGAGWRVGTSGIRVRGKDFGADARGGLWFQGDGTRPWIDIAADIAEAPVPVAKGFWIHDKMSKATVDWLNRALVGGKVHDGHALVSGDLDHWPFVHNDGRFEATARIDGGQFKFQPDWPAMDHVDAQIAFIGNGFSIEGQGALAGVRVEAFKAAIPDFGKAELSVSARGESDAAQMLAMLRQSPLQKKYGDTLTNLTASGPAHATYDMLLPLHAQHAAARKTKGTVELSGTKLADKRWNLAFDDVRGKADFDGDGFAAEKLAVSQKGQPGVLSLRAGSGVRDKQKAFEAELAANLTATELLDRAPEMAWLKPYIEGRSQWTVGVTLPKGGAADAPSQLKLHSDLVGTRLRLPAPLDKPTSQPLSTTVQTAMPMGSGNIDVAFGKLLALRARGDEKQTGVRVVLGSNVVNEAPPASGLVATGHTSSLDAIEWIALAKSGSGGGDKLPLRRIDVNAERLLLLGSAFPDTRLQVAPAGNALAVKMEGQALSGALLVPDAGGAVIAGRLARLYWRDASPGPAGAAVANDASTDAFNPAAIPPLKLDIDDLRFGDASLGSAQLRTQQVAAGMRIQQLALRSPGQKIDVQGDWLGRGAGARTQLSADIDSQDLGSLMDSLGFKGRVGGGKGTVKFNAGWSGSPAAFALSRMEGNLHIAARDGQLLEVEPGAGRVLGLLSLTQLPRRMMLDFRDFFSKGFAFNHIDGNVRFGAGVARSEDMVIDGPAAQIKIRGNTDLRAQRFDQTIEVLPKSGNVLAVVGAVTAGPLGAAIGAAANAVLRKPLGELGSKTYRVTGPWKDPKVEVISREQSRIEAAGVAGRAGGL
ncbi:TIGR02099 family protein [Pseudoxanthomonas yeongjuensis]|uniref:YhdP family protein n=1 Tax=Pseudoxanthomonas yeongjuensis TaxID=377616 RepID=UPI0013913D2D|nr:YhdP family protein [Pseudoxanthomonas yeongjuensis]KAF1718706.1 TIGR02099 family protein [Pseudoxanthomonas yeongjuensis]